MILYFKGGGDTDSLSLVHVFIKTMGVKSGNLPVHHTVLGQLRHPIQLSKVTMFGFNALRVAGKSQVFYQQMQTDATMP